MGDYYNSVEITYTTTTNQYTWTLRKYLVQTLTNIIILPSIIFHHNHCYDLEFNNKHVGLVINQKIGETSWVTIFTKLTKFCLLIKFRRNIINIQCISKTHKHKQHVF